MKVFHGSVVVVERPSLQKVSHTLDFGKGFYVTTDKTQAIKWAKIKMRRENVAIGLVTEYETDEKLLCSKHFDVKRFKGASRAWLNFVLANRLGKELHQYDIVTGLVANDRVYTCLNAFDNGFMDFETVIRKLKAFKLTDQISFHTSKAIKELHYVNSFEVKL
ncbi:MAG: DUF3990 domain-containing protein [Anaerovoracaceae bacterium]